MAVCADILESHRVGGPSDDQVAADFTDGFAGRAIVNRVGTAARSAFV